MYKTACKNFHKKLEPSVLGLLAKNKRGAGNTPPRRIEYLYDGERVLQARIDDYKKKKGTHALYPTLLEELIMDIQTMIRYLAHETRHLGDSSVAIKRKTKPSKIRIKLEKAKSRIGYYYAIKKDIEKYCS